MTRSVTGTTAVVAQLRSRPNRFDDLQKMVTCVSERDQRTWSDLYEHLDLTTVQIYELHFASTRGAHARTPAASQPSSVASLQAQARTHARVSTRTTGSARRVAAGGWRGFELRSSAGEKRNSARARDPAATDVCPRSVKRSVTSRLGDPPLSARLRRRALVFRTSRVSGGNPSFSLVTGVSTRNPNPRGVSSENPSSSQVNGVLGQNRLEFAVQALAMTMMASRGAPSCAGVFAKTPRV